MLGEVRHSILASALQSVDLGSIPLTSYPVDYRSGIYSFPTQCSTQKRQLCGDKASKFVVLLEKARFRLSPSLRYRQIVWVN